MKKTIVLLTVLLMLVASILTVTSARALQVSNYPNELAYIDAQVDVMLPLLEDFQAAYHGVNDRYYQALHSHSSPPDVPEVPDGIYQSPSDQSETLAYFWTYSSLPDTLAWSMRIDTYSGPDGDGYVLNVETVINGETWTRSVNYGPDDWRGYDWYQVTEE